MTCRLFCDHLDTLLAESNFSFDFYAFVILKNVLTFFQFFSASCFFIIRPQVFSKISEVVLVRNSCLDEVILAEIVFWGSQFTTKIGLIFYHVLTDLIFVFFFVLLF